MVFLHGITGSCNYWNRAIPRLEKDFRLVMPDLLGFGRSPKPDLDYTMPVFVRSFREFLEREGLTGIPLNLVGHSLGALVALEYSALQPENVARLVLLSVPRHESREAAHATFLEHSVNYRRILGVNTVSSCVRSALAVGPGVFFAYLTRFPSDVLRDSTRFTLRSLLTTLDNCLLGYRVDSVLPRVPAVPTLLLHGEKDMVAPVGNAIPLTEALPGSRLLVLGGTGHHLFLTHPRRCLDEMEAFLRRPPARPEVVVRRSAAAR